MVMVHPSVEPKACWEFEGDILILHHPTTISVKYQAMGKFAIFLITGSIAQSATCRYLVYSEADFEVFCPARATRCTDWGEIWHGEVPSSVPNFTPIGATTRV